MSGTKVTTTTPEEDFWGYFEGERVWLGPPEKRPVDEYLITDGEQARILAQHNDNNQSKKLTN